MTIVDVMGLPQPGSPTIDSETTGAATAALDQADGARLAAVVETVDLTDNTNDAAADSDYHELAETLVATMTLGGCCDIAASPPGIMSTWPTTIRSR